MSNTSDPIESNKTYERFDRVDVYMTGHESTCDIIGWTGEADWFTYWGTFSLYGDNHEIYKDGRPIIVHADNLRRYDPYRDYFNGSDQFRADLDFINESIAADQYGEIATVLARFVPYCISKMPWHKQTRKIDEYI